MKTLLLLTLMSGTLLLQSFVAAPEDEKIRNEFQSAFPQADSVQWRESDSGADVLFVSGGIHCHIWYANDGSVIKAYRYASRDFLSPYLQLMLKKEFPHLELYGIEETSSENDVRYELTMQDKDNWYHVTGNAYGHFRMNHRYQKAR